MNRDIEPEEGPYCCPIAACPHNVPQGECAVNGMCDYDPAEGDEEE
ncbi:hypothetical protein SDC9_142192 [bioreactor metagenome]|uniref:Uncharacterized protein n=1 Tax=bioreactor metagenome TaxID=1076179 RepID=A0A645E0F9_9ZZZZ